MARYSDSHFRGVLLEEAVAALLSRSGFEVISSASGDPSLSTSGAGLTVRGRGADHQVDVLADFSFVAPFSYPPRLLLEAKFRDDPTGLEVIRDAVGVVKDVSEWFQPSSHAPNSRYHYQAAVFSKSRFTKGAERYAYAHDVFLVPLGDNRLFHPVIRAISKFGQINHLRREYGLNEARSMIRRVLAQPDETPPEDVGNLAALQTAIARIGAAYLARTSGGFPLFLVPRSDREVDRALVRPGPHDVEVRYDTDGGWRLVAREQDLEFSFDLPRELMTVFGADNRLRAEAAVDMKRREFDQIFAYRLDNGRIRTMQLSLDTNWLDAVQSRMRH